jgi:DNA-binding beta-propeller fold protein YncE
VISVAKAELEPEHAVVSRIAAGCTPVRVVVPPAGKTVWTTARSSNELLALLSRKLVHDPKHALLTAMHVGEAPVGVTTFDHGQRIAVADANHNYGGGTITIVDSQRRPQGFPQPYRRDASRPLTQIRGRPEALD